MSDRQLIVRYLSIGQTITGSVRAKDLPDQVAVPDPGGTLAVEYLIQDPRNVRPAGASASKADDISFWRAVGLTMVACAVLAGIAFAAGQVRARRQPRH